MKLFVDDVRQAPDGWMVVRTIDEAKLQLSRDDIEAVSLDHDMGACPTCEAEGKSVGDMLTPETTYAHWCPHASDGYGLVMWMIENHRLPKEIRVHSMNPVGKARMIAALNHIPSPQADGAGE